MLLVETVDAFGDLAGADRNAEQEAEVELFAVPLGCQVIDEGGLDHLAQGRWAAGSGHGAAAEMSRRTALSLLSAVEGSIDRARAVSL